MIFNYFLSLFIFINKIKTNDNTLCKFKNIDLYDNRNLSTFNDNITNLTTIFDKYDLLIKLKDNNYNIHQKMEFLNNNDIKLSNIKNGGLLNDWNIS